MQERSGRVRRRRKVTLFQELLPISATPAAPAPSPLGAAPLC
jgi:hypothetical protein